MPIPLDRRLCLCSQRQMSGPIRASTLEVASERLRAMALESDADVMLGSEDMLRQVLQVSRSTLRQVARLLEREGLLRVRRGIGGGYYSARPDLAGIKATISAHLQTLHVEPGDITAVAAALWVELVRQAAALPEAARQEATTALADQVRAMQPGIGFEEIRAVEDANRAALFSLVKSPYVELIFQINLAFAQRHFREPVKEESGEVDRAFLKAWRTAKLLELGAIADGDGELAAMAARHSRNIWHGRVMRRIGSELRR
jgi:DNA-binding FadR family transcriptional regulator